MTKNADPMSALDNLPGIILRWEEGLSGDVAMGYVRALRTPETREDEVARIAAAMERAWPKDGLLSIPQSGPSDALIDAFYDAGLRAPSLAPKTPEHPHDGYAYSGCDCICCTNVRALQRAASLMTWAQRNGWPEGSIRDEWNPPK